MTISATTRIAGPFAANGATTAFDFEFKVFIPSDVTVLLLDSSGVETTLVLNTDYTLSLNADQNADPGGTVTTVSTYAAGNSITIVSEVEATQGVDLTSGGAFYPEVVENALDRAIVLLQQAEEKLNKAVLVAASQDGALPRLPGAVARAGKFLVFDNDGNPALASGVTTAPVAEFWEDDVLLTTTAAAARAALEISYSPRAFALAPAKELVVNIAAAASTFGASFDFAVMRGNDRTSKRARITLGGFSGSFATTGVGGLDAGTKQANTWYYLFIISLDNVDENNFSSLISASSDLADDSSNIVMPTGYVYRGMLSAVRTNGSAETIAMSQMDGVACSATGTALSAGSATSPTAVQLANYVPAGAKAVRFKVSVARASGSVAETTTLYAGSSGGTVSAVFNIPAGSSTAPQIFTTTVPLGVSTLDTRTIYYTNANATGRTTLEVIGWEF